MKTILHTIDTTGPGGAETVFIDMVTGLPATRYRSIAVIRGEGWVSDEMRRRGVEPLFMNNKGSFNLRYLTRLVALIKREKVDLIQSHLLGSNVYCSLAGLITCKPVVATFHGAVDFEMKNKLTWAKYRAINAGADNVIAVSQELRNDILGRTLIKPAKIQVIYNGIRTADFQRPRSGGRRNRYGWSANEFIIGSLGNIRPAGYDILLRAASILVRENSRLRFVIAGQGKAGLFDDLLLRRDSTGARGTGEASAFVKLLPGFSPTWICFCPPRYLKVCLSRPYKQWLRNCLSSPPAVEGIRSLLNMRRTAGWLMWGILKQLQREYDYWPETKNYV